MSAAGGLDVTASILDLPEIKAAAFVDSQKLAAGNQGNTKETSVSTAIVAALVSLGVGCTTTAATTAPAGGASRPLAVEVLANGLTLVVQEHRAADIVAVYLWVATGVRYESRDTLGHAHFQEHMLPCRPRRPRRRPPRS